MKRSLILLFGLLLALHCSAAEYSLHGDSVHFSVPDDWSAIMQKTEGNPQFYAFQVRNPNAQTTLTRVSVTVNQMADRAAVEAYVQDAVRNAESSKGYKAMDGNKPAAGSLQYSADEDGQRQVYRKDFFQHDNMVVTLLCVRPQDAPAGAAWLHAYEQACARIATDLSR